MLTSRSLFAPLNRLFRYTDDEERQMQVQFARIMVLFNDLALETTAAEEDSIRLLDTNGKDARRFYFVRRAIATLSELRNAILALNRNRSFGSRRSKWDNVPRQEWDDLVRFFERNHQFLKDWRNDVGGHFGDGVAAFALDNLEPETIAVLELFREGDTVDVRVRFAYDLVATAMVRQRDAERQSVNEFVSDALRFFMDAVHHGRNASRIIIATEFLDKFGR